jgi:hypothetical protein
MSYEEEDTVELDTFSKVCVCHIGRRIHACHMRRRTLWSWIHSQKSVYSGFSLLMTCSPFTRHGRACVANVVLMWC